MLAREVGVSAGEPHSTSEAGATLARLGLADLRPVYQPVVDLRDGRVVGYEALVRGGPGSPLESPAELFALARTEDVVAEFDAACRAAAVRGFEHRRRRARSRSSSTRRPTRSATRRRSSRPPATRS